MAAVPVQTFVADGDESESVTELCSAKTKRLTCTDI